MHSTDSPLTLAIASTFVANPIEPALAFWFDELDLDARIDFAPYNQPFQQLLDQSSLLSTNSNGINIMLVRLEDWREPALNRETDKAGAIDWRLDLEQKIREFVHAITVAARRSAIPHLLVSCPCSRVAQSDAAYSDFFGLMEEVIGAALASVPGVEFVNSAELMSAYDVDGYDDPQGEQLAHIPYTPLFFTALASVIARRVYELTHAAYKVVAIDCDQVLWTGICGEDGPLGVKIDATRQAIQDFLIHIHDKGMLLCLCSRNNEIDVLDVFRRRAEMRLTPEHIVASKLNWKPKSENIKALASELQLAPDAFVFLDDDPVECAEVQANCPEALTIQLPNRAESIPRFLRNLWMFRGSQPTDEARQRTAFYQANVARGRVLQNAPTLTDFLARLDLKIHVTSLAPRHLARASELTHRTNQFNATTIRRSDAQIDALLQQGTTCLVVQVRDRFGDYGLVGLMIYSAAADALIVDTFLLSCRALGRGVEHRMLAKLGQIATEQGLARVDIPFVPSGRNHPMLDFLRDTAGQHEETLDAGTVFRFPAVVAAQARYCPEALGNRGNEHPAVPTVERNETLNGQVIGQRSAAFAVDTRAKAALLVTIASDLSRIDQIHTLVCARTRTMADLNRPYIAPRTPVEQRVTAILAEVLGLERVGLEDDFFEIGGHSLLAMQVLFKIREAFQLEFSVRLLYAGAFTAVELAKKVVQLQLQVADSPKIDALIEGLDKLSDDEVRAMLAQRANPPLRAAK